MSSTTRANSLFTLPGVSQYTRTNSLTTVIDNIELDNNGEIREVKEKNSLVCSGLVCEAVAKRSKNGSIHELEVQLMMKDKMIEELLEENGKLIENMNKLEQDKLDERNRIQQGTDMVIQQIVEDNEWYKSQFLEMKSELEKAITQTRSKGREISTMEKRCKTLIEEKETIQNFLDELTFQYDKRVEQLKNYKDNLVSMIKLTNKFVGTRNKYCKGSDHCSIHDLVSKIREIINTGSNLNNIEHLVTQIQFNAKKFETEINEIYENIHKNTSVQSLDNSDSQYKCEKSINNKNNNLLEKNSIISNFEREMAIKDGEFEASQKVINKGYENISLKNKYNKVTSELENSRNEIEKLKYEIKRKSEIIQELKTLNRENSDILDNINDKKENQQIRLLVDKISLLNNEKRELIQKIARSNLENQNITGEYENRKLLMTTEQLSRFKGIKREISDNIIENEESRTFNVTSCDNECNFAESKVNDITLNYEFGHENFEETKEDKANSSISKIVDKYINYPIDYAERKQIIQRNSVQRNRYF
ncbi:coiled coil protein [Cryptosporidium ryanae]|uniref:coiled coil protein n=1 Tax=Cryptosporidium ryanae TaxID=515981 RepID=UPI003519F631|nr:coiled coil protein [Cryptosporidium ryanae]